MPLASLRKKYTLHSRDRFDNEIFIFRVAPYDFYEVRFKNGRTPDQLNGQYTNIMEADRAIKLYVERDYQPKKNNSLRGRIVKEELVDPYKSPWVEDVNAP